MPTVQLEKNLTIMGYRKYGNKFQRQNWQKTDIKRIEVKLLKLKTFIKNTASERQEQNLKSNSMVCLEVQQKYQDKIPA